MLNAIRSINENNNINKLYEARDETKPLLSEW